MGQLTRIAYGRLDALVDEHGADWLLDLVVSRIAVGESIGGIARALGMTNVVLKKWIEDSPVRVSGVELAHRCFAEELEFEALGEVRGADPETVQLAKLRYESYVKSAGFRDRKRFGNRTDVEVTQTHVVDIRELLAKREARLEEMVGNVVEVVVRDDVITEVGDA